MLQKNSFLCMIIGISENENEEMDNGHEKISKVTGQIQDPLKASFST